jgi:hypothetical protein
MIHTSRSDRSARWRERQVGATGAYDKHKLIILYIYHINDMHD